jgi:hypothetical protein
VPDLAAQQAQHHHNPIAGILFEAKQPGLATPAAAAAPAAATPTSALQAVPGAEAVVSGEADMELE